MLSHVAAQTTMKIFKTTIALISEDIKSDAIQRQKNFKPRTVHKTTVQPNRQDNILCSSVEDSTFPNRTFEYVSKITIWSLCG